MSDWRLTSSAGIFTGIAELNDWAISNSILGRAEIRAEHTALPWKEPQTRCESCGAPRRYRIESCDYCGSMYAERLEHWPRHRTVRLLATEPPPE